MVCHRPGMEIIAVRGLDPAQHDLFDAWAAVWEQTSREQFGDDHSAWSADELRESEKGTDKLRYAAAAVEGEDVIGAGGVILPLADNTSLAMVNVAVVADARRRGIGTALQQWAEQIAADHGRTTVLSESTWSGADAAADPARCWARGRGFQPAQTVVRQDLALPVRVDAALATAYALETHVDGVPAADLDDRALLARRISTDAPMGELDLEEENWDAQRVLELYERARGMGRQVVETFARHRESGRLVGFTHVQTNLSRPTVAFVQDTLVVREHRGHGLGAAMKLANHRTLAELAPHVQTVRTWNAAENTPMLAVNAALGYRATGFTQEWQKKLS